MARESDNKVGIIAGSFDLIHPGYIRLFKSSKDFCNKLIIALQDDPTVDRPYKCKPVQTLEERKEILESIKYIDQIVTYRTEEDLFEILKNTEYNYRILSEEYKESVYTGKDLKKDVIWIERRHSYSTTSLKEKIYLERKSFHEGTSV